MKIAKQILKILSEELSESEKPVNYTVKGILHFDDGVNKGNTKIKATSAQEAEKIFREKMHDIWDKKGGLKKVEIVSVTKG